MRTLLTALLTTATALAASPVVDRVGKTAFIQIEAESFRTLTPKQQALAYWLSQSAIAIDPTFHDQMSRFGLTEKRLLEAAITNKPPNPAIFEFTKLFWANKGNHNELTSQKFLPAFTFDDLKKALEQANRKDLLPDLETLRQPLFDPNFEPLITAKSPVGGQDILQASANSFYPNLSLADLKGFTEHYRLNSRVERVNGKLTEQVYRTGNSTIKPGLYADYLKHANDSLAHARAYAEPKQQKVIDDLIRYYQTGEYKDWLQFDIDWVQDDEPVDFANGFIEIYRDARGAKGSSQAFVSITDKKLSATIAKIAANAQYFENNAPWNSDYKKQGVKPPLANAVETLIETGDFHVTTTGDNLPNEDEIRAKYGSKSFLFTGSTKALDAATGDALIDEFVYSPEEAALDKKYGAESEQLLTAMHEVIGHGSGKLNPKLTHEAAFYLKEYFSTLEEARADLMALWNVFDPKLKELGIISGNDTGRVMYNDAARVMLTQLRRIPKGDTIEEDHERNRQLIAGYIMAKTGAIATVTKNEKTYIVVKDYKKMRQGVGQLLAELQRIKSEGDYDAIKKLIDTYAIHFNPKTRDEVIARYQKLNLPTYFAGIYPDLTAEKDANGELTQITLSYPRDIVKQQLMWGRRFRLP